MARFGKVGFGKAGFGKAGFGKAGFGKAGFGKERTRRDIVASAAASLAAGGALRTRAATAPDGFVVLEAAPGRVDLAGESIDLWRFRGLVPGRCCG